MRILIFGASGYIGSHLTRHFVAAGHEVTGFARSEKAGAAVTELRARVAYGDLERPEDLADELVSQDAVIWAAQLMLEDEQRVLESFLATLAGTNKTLVFTGGTSLLSQRTDGEWSEDSYAEDDVFTPRKHIAPRLGIENIVRAGAQEGVRAMCIRPPFVYGEGGNKVIADLFHSGRKTGAVCYVGRGLNVYSNIHVWELADLYSLAIERGQAGALYHGVSGETAYRVLAEAVGRQMNLPTKSITVPEASAIWDNFMGPIVFAGCSRTRCPRARAELGWKPRTDLPGILEDIQHPVYMKQGEREAPSWVRKPR